jgi:hypothetical protein
MVGRPVIIPPVRRYYPTELKEWLRVPICLTCWLIDLQRNMQRRAAVMRQLIGHGDRHEQEQFDIEQIARRRCLSCGRPLRLYRPMYLNELVCCTECERKARNERNRVRRHVKHQPMRCLVCRNSFVPTRTDAQTCSNTCRQKLFRQRHRKPRKPRRRRALAEPTDRVRTAGPHRYTPGLEIAMTDDLQGCGASDRNGKGAVMETAPFSC